MVTIAPEPLGGFPEAWQAHESYAWEASAASQEQHGPYAFERPVLGPLRGWTTCSCGWESYPTKDVSLLPLTYREAMQAYLDHLPPGMADWLAKRQAMPQSDSERVARVRTVVNAARENGLDGPLLDSIEEAMGIVR